MDPEFYQALRNAIAGSQFSPSDYSWPDFQDNIEEAANLPDLIKVLKDIDNSILRSQGDMVEIEGKRVMLYNGDTPFALQECSLYARGLQFAYGAIRLMLWDGLPIETQILKDFIKQYTLKMENIGFPHTKESFSLAQQNTMEFIGMLSHYIAMERIRIAPPDISDPKNQQDYFDNVYLKAFSDLRKATELLSSIESNEDIICTFNQDPQTGTIQADISERLTFEITNPQTIQSQFWYQQNLEKHGSWFQKFITENGDSLLRSSPVCTTRDLPGPSNTWNEFTVTLDREGNLMEEHPSIRSAISSPFQIRNREARVQMAEGSIKAILNPIQLNTIAERYFNKWGPLLQGSMDITLPILHQTLVDPTFFYGADRDMIEVKTESDRVINDNYLNYQTREINGTVVKFNLLQTNNCINMWHPIINPRNSDIDDSERLVQSANFLICRLYDKINQDPELKNDLRAIIEYLDNQKRSIIMIKPFSNRDPNSLQQRAVERVTADLANGQLNESGLSSAQQHELALTLSAAVNLKKINHETYLGHWKRRLNNAVKIKGISLLSPITGILSSPVYLGRYLINSASRLTGYLRDKHPTTLGAVFLPTLNGYKNKQTFKSAYESILAGNVGMVFGGCESAYDRSGEARINQSAMIAEFNRTGKLADFFDSDRAYYDYLRVVSSKENAGHQYRIVAANDRIGGRKLWEILTHHYTQELSQDERDIAKEICAKFRKISSPPTGEAKESFIRDYVIETVPARAISKAKTNVTPRSEQKRPASMVFDRIIEPSEPEEHQPKSSPVPRTPSSRPGSMR